MNNTRNFFLINYFCTRLLYMSSIYSQSPTSEDNWDEEEEEEREEISIIAFDENNL